jgi:phosphatidate cytidylyltransferase
MASPLDKSRSLRDFGVRTGVALVLATVAVVVLFFGGVWGLAGAIALFGALATAELYSLARRERRLPNEVFGLGAVIAMPLAAASFGPYGLTAVVSGLVIVALVWHMLIRQVRLSDTAITVFGAVYVGFTLSHVVLIRQLDNGTILALTTAVAVWLNDIFAYLVGSSVGRHLLAPRISPHKTWEGLAAGTVATTGTWVAAGLIWDVALPMGWLVAIGIAAAIASVTGDLAESRIKREVGVKDSGGALPGHGGFLDRFDAFIMACIVTYYMLTLAGAR